MTPILILKHVVKIFIEGVFLLISMAVGLGIMLVSVLLSLKIWLRIFPNDFSDLTTNQWFPVDSLFNKLCLAGILAAAFMGGLWVARRFVSEFFRSGIAFRKVFIKLEDDELKDDEETESRSLGKASSDQ